MVSAAIIDAFDYTDPERFGWCLSVFSITPSDWECPRKTSLLGPAAIQSLRRLSGDPGNLVRTLFQKASKQTEFRKQGRANWSAVSAPRMEEGRSLSRYDSGVGTLPAQQPITAWRVLIGACARFQACARSSDGLFDGLKIKA
jgi:hypothetical protein